MQGILSFYQEEAWFQHGPNWYHNLNYEWEIKASTHLLNMYMFLFIHHDY